MKFGTSALLALAVAVAASAPGRADESAVRLTYSDLNLKSIEGARHLYSRIYTAANYACGASDTDMDVIVRFGPSRCVKEAIARAVRNLNSPQLSRVYIERNGADVASSFGIRGESTLVASK